MRMAIVYYSFEGNTAYVAQCLADELGIELARLQTPDEPRTHGFGKFLWFGWQGILGRKPRVEPVGLDLAAYDLLILGGPVWGGRYAPAMQQFIREQLPANIPVAPFCCAKGHAGKTLILLTEQLGEDRVREGLALREPIANQPAARDKAVAWARAL